MCSIKGCCQNTNSKWGGENFKGLIENLTQDHGYWEYAMKKEIGV
jgi:hypothetical protein